MSDPAAFRIDRATVSLAPRTLAHCLDMAFVFYGRHLREVLRLWAWFAVPCCIAAWWFTGPLGMDVRWVLVLPWFATAPFGAILVSGAAADAFGGNGAGAFRSVDRRVLHLGIGRRRLLIGVGPALVLFPEHWALFLLGMLLCFFPSAWLLVRTGFSAEEEFLKDIDQRRRGPRIRELIRGENADLYSRGLMLVLFCMLIGIVLYLTIDGASARFFQFPILVERVMLGEIAPEDAAMYFATSPRTVVPLVAVILLVYPLGRLAWFFCYIDIRVRRDCWDMELLMTREAARLAPRRPPT